MYLCVRARGLEDNAEVIKKELSEFLSSQKRYVHGPQYTYIHSYMNIHTVSYIHTYTYKYIHLHTYIHDLLYRSDSEDSEVWIGAKAAG